MWQQITTLSEIDTVKTGTLVAKTYPENGNSAVYKVSGRSEDYMVLVPADNAHLNDGLTIAADDLFDKGWWMMKTH